MFSVGAFLSFVFLATFTPGPGNIGALSVSGKHGFKKGIMFSLGGGIGAFTVFSLGALFTYSLYVYMPKIEPVMCYVGAGYILYLAYKTYKDTPSSNNNKSDFDASIFISGMLLQFVNPKLILYAITVFSSFILPYYQKTYEVLGFALFLGLLSLISQSLWALFGTGFQRLYEKNKKAVNIILALALVACAMSVLPIWSGK